MKKKTPRWQMSFGEYCFWLTLCQVIDGWNWMKREPIAAWFLAFAAATIGLCLWLAAKGIGL